MHWAEVFNRGWPDGSVTKGSPFKTLLIYLSDRWAGRGYLGVGGQQFGIFAGAVLLKSAALRAAKSRPSSSRLPSGAMKIRSRMVLSADSFAAAISLSMLGGRDESLPFKTFDGCERLLKSAQKFAPLLLTLIPQPLVMLGAACHPLRSDATGQRPRDTQPRNYEGDRLKLHTQDCTVPIAPGSLTRDMPLGRGLFTRYNAQALPKYALYSAFRQRFRWQAGSIRTRRVHD